MVLTVSWHQDTVRVRMLGHTRWPQWGSPPVRHARPPGASNRATAYRDLATEQLQLSLCSVPVRRTPAALFLLFWTLRASSWLLPRCWNGQGGQTSPQHVHVTARCESR